MYCQSCGAENTEGARFCNMCGTSLAKAGEAGGPLPSPAAQMAEPTVPDPPKHAQSAGPRNQPGRTMVGAAGQSGDDAPAPSGRSVGYGGDLGASGPSMMGVSLAGIGVRSSKKAWTLIFLGAVALLGAGALASWLAMGGSGAGSEGHAEADDPFVIGSPLPAEGDVDSITGMAGVATSAGDRSPMGGAAGMSTSNTMGATSPTGGTGTMRTSTMRNSGGTSSTSTSTMTTAMASTMTSSTMTSGTMTTGTMTTEMTSTEMTTEMGSGTTEMSGSTPMAITPMGGIEAPEERDIEMELYSARVRFLIQRYYAGRAQSCFDRATRNTPSVSGTVVISMTIGAEGNVTRTRVARNTTGNEALGNCLSAQVSSWRLSAPPGGSLQMQIPFSR